MLLYGDAVIIKEKKIQLFDMKYDLKYEQEELE